MGFEFRRFRSVLSRSRYLSIFDYQLALESTLWKISKSVGKNTVLITGSYPRVVNAMPFVLCLDRLSVCYRDESDPVTVTDVSGYQLYFPSIHKWIHFVFGHFLRVFSPTVQLEAVECIYSYKFVDGVGELGRMEFESSLTSVRIYMKDWSIETSSLMCKLFHNRELLKVSLPTGCKGEYNRGTNIFNIETDLVDFDAFFRNFRDCQDLYSLKAPKIPASSFKLAVNLLVKGCTMHGHMKNLSVFMNLEKRFGGFFISAILDPIALKLDCIEMHNFFDHSKSGKEVSIQLRENSAIFSVVNFSNVNCIADWKNEGSYKLNVQIKSCILAVMETRLVYMRAISILASECKGTTLSLNLVDIDVSPRIVSRIVRVYLKLTQLFVDGEASPEPAHIIRPFVTDLNYFLLMQRATPTLTPQVSVAEFPVSMTPTLSTAPPAVREAKNWRSMERFAHEKGKAILNLIIDKLIVKNDESPKLVIEKLKVVSKISSIGSPFTSVNLDKFSLNDNIVSKQLAKGGLRIWIDGYLSSIQAKVFCLVPPIAIRFDSQFAAIMERYFLEIVDVLKPISRSSMSTKFIEFLQISSLQLELHAKEMLGVLSLDKAMINLSRSSVYKSDGVLDAVSALAGKYREELVGQWLSLLMRLDVSIGRPVSTARNLIGGITSFFRNGSSTNELNTHILKSP